MKYVTVNSAPSVGIDFTSIIIGTLVIMYVLFVAARGSLPKYVSIFYG